MKMLAGDVEALSVVASFLAWAERQDPRMMYGGHTVAEAFDALAHLVRIKPRDLREVAS